MAGKPGVVISCITIPVLNKLLENGMTASIVSSSSDFMCKKKFVKEEDVQCGSFYGLVFNPGGRPLFIISIPCV